MSPRLLLLLIALPTLNARGAAVYPEADGDWPAALLPPMNGRPADFAPRRAGAEVEADVRFGISSAGVYRVTQSELAALGLNPAALIGEQLRLFCRTQEVAILVSTNGLFGPQDALLFYGAGHSGAYSATNVYWLGIGGSGLRMAAEDSSPAEGGTLVTSHVERARYAPKLLYRNFYRPLDDSFDHWFAALLSSNSTAAAVTTDARLADATATISATCYGLTSEPLNPDHTTIARINGSNVLQIVYDGEEDATATNAFSSSLLTDGVTTVSLLQTAPGAANDRAYLQQFFLDYPRRLQARNGQLVFWGRPGTNLYAVTGLPVSDGLLAFDITDPAAPVRLLNAAVSAEPGNFTLTFRHVSSAARRYLVAAPSRVGPPPEQRRVFFRGLAAPGQQADFILLCPYPLRAPGYALLKHRALNGLRAIVAPPEDVYNEFSYGIVDAAAIKQFLGYAFHHWAGPPPRYACLVGAGTYDPRNNLNQNPPLTLPTYLGPSSFAWSAQDNWFATVNGSDRLPDLALGRIPVSSADELQRVVDKIRGFEAATPTKNATLVADNVDGALNFKAATTNFIRPPLAAAGYALSQQYLDDTSAGTIRNNIRNTVNAGRHLLTFFGHGSVNAWCAEDVWNTNDVALLTNSRPPIVAVFSCENGAFDNPARSGLGEVFLRRGNGAGAVGCVAPASLSVQTYAEKLAAGFFADFTNSASRLGDSMQAGLLNLWQFNPNVSELATYLILGDPALEKY